MREQAPKILRLVCVMLAALVLYQLAHVVSRVNILGHVVIPALPMLETNAPPANVVVSALKPPTNSMEGGKTNLHSTNASSASSGGLTNILAQTNVGPPMIAGSTNKPGVVTNGANIAASTNIALMPMPLGTNEVTNVIYAGTNLSETNLIAKTNGSSRRKFAGTNGGVTNLDLGTNFGGTNAGPMAKGKSKRSGGGGMPPGMMMMGGMGMGMGAPLAELPPDVKARVDRVYESEILGQAIRPLPAGLLGIAGDEAFLRAGSGQTGMIKEGETLGELKLVRIGVNRVLVDQGGEKKELMIFDGYGGTSLLPEKGKNPE
jgi:hypothetical protein